MHQRGVPGAEGVAILDGGQDRLVPGQAEALDVGAAVGDADGLAQRQRQHVAHVGEQVVAGGVGDRPVKIQVGLQELLVGLGRLHGLVGFLDHRDVRVGRGGGGHGGDFRLEDAAHAGQGVEELAVRRRLHQPGQHVRVQQVPFRPWPHHRADPWLGVHQALGTEHPGGFAQHRAADLVFLTQRCLQGQSIFRLEASGDDVHAQILNDPGMHALTGFGRLVIHNREAALKKLAAS
ncbi:hypothetical protein EMIT0196P_60163 [Pseudomonas chlororaphis]